MTPWTVARQASLVHGILQARILKWVAIPSPGDLPDPGIELKGLLHCRQIIYHLSHHYKGRPIIKILAITLDLPDNLSNLSKIFNLTTSAKSLFTRKVAYSQTGRSGCGIWGRLFFSLPHFKGKSMSQSSVYPKFPDHSLCSINIHHPLCLHFVQCFYVFSFHSVCTTTCFEGENVDF